MAALRGAEALRSLLGTGTVLRVPCAYDGISARVAEQAGFPAVALSGNAVSGSVLGLPDVGVLGMAENVEHAGRIARSLAVPLICDADTGYGGVLNVIRTVKEFEAAGVAGIHIEDQVTPKRCGLLPQGIPVVSCDEQVRKIKAAVHARRSPDFLVIARTDAKSSYGLQDAALRARAYIEAGAGAALVVGANSPEELRFVSGVVRAPLVCLIHETPPTAELADDLLSEVGCVLALHVGTMRYAVVKALQTVAAALFRDRNTAAVRHLMASFEEYNNVLGTDEWIALEKKYLG